MSVDTYEPSINFSGFTSSMNSLNFSGFEVDISLASNINFSGFHEVEDFANEEPLACSTYTSQNLVSRLRNIRIIPDSDSSMELSAVEPELSGDPPIQIEHEEPELIVDSPIQIEYEEPIQMEFVELEIREPRPRQVAGDPLQEITYEILPATTQSKNPKPTLHSSDLQEYVRKPDKRRTGEDWKCSDSKCNAKVLFRNGIYKRNSTPHSHGPRPLLKTTRMMRKNGKEAGVAQPRAKASDLARREIANLPEDDIDQFGGIIMTDKALAEQISRTRRNGSKPNPSEDDLFFDIDEEWMENNPDIPWNFKRSDIRENGERHVIFASDIQLDFLQRAEILFVDATYKTVRRPFYQLFTVHCFVKSGTYMKQVPLCFILMSRRRRIDYEAVLRGIVSLVPNLNVNTVVSDFEAALWVGIRNILPDVRMRGCLFHFDQCVYRKMLTIGLKTDYILDINTRELCKQLMALPLLPAEHIPTMFDRLVSEVEKAENIPKCQELVDYFRKTWIESNLFPIESWCWYGENVRTNNDLEGWHHKLNQDAKNIRFYLMMHILGMEAKTVHLNITLVRHQRVTRRQKKGVKDAQKEIEVYWKKYREDEINPRRLLLKLSELLKPSDVYKSPSDPDNVEDPHHRSFRQENDQ